MSTDTGRGTFEHFGFGVPWEDTANYSQGVRAGNLLFIAGQLAHDLDGNLLGEGEFAVQADGALANIGLVVGSHQGTDAQWDALNRAIYESWIKPALEEA